MRWNKKVSRKLKFTTAVMLTLLLVVFACTAILVSCGDRSPGEEVPSGSIYQVSRELKKRQYAFDLRVKYYKELLKTPVYENDRVMEHIRQLSESIGMRISGTEGDERAAAYIEECLLSAGYEPWEQTFPIPGGRSSRNIGVTFAGNSSPDKTIVVGAHYDTRGPSPGADDNGTGVAVLLELARILGPSRVAPTLEIVFFGAEEVIPGGTRDDHHFGSRYYVATLDQARRASLVGMISVDMVGYGSELLMRNLGIAGQGLRVALENFFNSRGIPCTYRRDTGYSDHESFERAGIPVVWVEWRDDPYIHTERDNFDHVDPVKVEVVGRNLWLFLRSLTAESLKSF